MGRRVNVKRHPELDVLLRVFASDMEEGGICFGDGAGQGSVKAGENWEVI